MSSSAVKLDPPKKGPPRKTHSIAIDLDDLPDDLVAAYVEACKPYRHDAAMIKRIEASKARGREIKKAVWQYRMLKKRKKGVYRVDSGMGARVLAMAGDWTTFHEFRVALNTYPGFIRRVTDRLWRRGQLLKRKNPAWSGRLGWGKGVSRCMYQYKASIQVDHAPQCDKDERGKSVQDAREKA